MNAQEMRERTERGEKRIARERRDEVFAMIGRAADSGMYNMTFCTSNEYNYEWVIRDLVALEYKIEKIIENKDGSCSYMISWAKK